MKYERLRQEVIQALFDGVRITVRVCRIILNTENVERKERMDERKYKDIWEDENFIRDDYSSVE